MAQGDRLPPCRAGGDAMLRASLVETVSKYTVEVAYVGALFKQHMFSVALLEYDGAIAVGSNGTHQITQPLIVVM